MTTETNTKVSKGEVIFFSEGAYSDYGYCGNVVFVKDCDLKNEVAAYTRNKKPEWYFSSQEYLDSEDYNYIGCPSDFCSFLIVRGLCVPLDCREIHLGSYGKFDKDFKS